MKINNSYFIYIDNLYKLSGLEITNIINENVIDLDVIKYLLIHAKTRFGYIFNDPDLDNSILVLYPLKFTQIVDLAALYRPGPIDMNMLDKYINKEVFLINYLNLPEKVMGVMECTAGIPIYQEQMIKIIMLVSGCDKEAAWEIFKIILKSRHEKLAKLVNTFIKNGIRQNFALEEIHEIWNFLLRCSMYTYKMRHAIIYVRYAYISTLLKSNGYLE